MITTQILSNNTLTVVLDNGKQILTATKSHPKWKEILDAYNKQDRDRILQLLSMKRVVETFSEGGLVVSKNGIFYKNIPISGVDVNRILEFLKQGLPYKPIAKYMIRVMKNPSRRAIDEMYKFLEHKSMPLTPDGKIVAYKAVQKDFYSITSGDEPLIKGHRNKVGQILNSIGETIEMDRSNVNDDFRIGCSGGLHAGSLKYAMDFANTTTGGIIILVEIDPADVVSVPEDCDCSKVRCCKYKVIDKYTGPLPDSYLNEYGNYDANSEYKMGYEAGKIDGKKHRKRKYFDKDEDSEAQNLSFIEGYNSGYNSRSDYKSAISKFKDGVIEDLEQCKNYYVPKTNKNKFENEGFDYEEDEDWEDGEK